MMEHLRYDDFGNLLTATFSDYCPITILNMPDVKYGNLESPSPFTYNGAKGWERAVADRCIAFPQRSRTRLKARALLSIARITLRAICMRCLRKDLALG